MDELRGAIPVERATELDLFFKSSSGTRSAVHRHSWRRATQWTGTACSYCEMTFEDWAVAELAALMVERDDLKQRLDLLVRQAERVRARVDQQAEDAGLWFFAQTAAEAYLQQELRKLHAVIEAIPLSR